MAARRNATATTAGLLRPDEFARHVRLTRLPCGPAVGGWVENYWWLRWDLPEGTHFPSSVVAHPACTLSVERGHPRPEIGAERVVLTGVYRHRFDVDTRGSGWTMGVKFRPSGLAAYAGLDAAMLTDRVVPASAHLRADLVDAFGALGPDDCDADCAAAAELALAARLPDQDPAYDLVLDVVADLLGDRTVVRVEQLEQRHGISRRRLQRIFARYVGVTPKWVLARARMHEAVAELDAGYAGALSDLAIRYGWYDQAHFGRDFVAVTGVTPSAYRAVAERT